MWICLCEAVTSKQIVEVIASGARTVGDIGRVCRAGTVCGKCRRNIAVLLAQSGHETVMKEGGWG